MITVNEQVKSLYCIRCGKEFPLSDMFFGCPDCLEKRENSSVSFRYKNIFRPNSSYKGMARYGEKLPYKVFPTLGEGNTPQVELSRAAKKFGLQKLYIKNEFQNPTGSHKDRASALVIARALELKRNIVTATSSGNAGISLAVYAALSGLKCKIWASTEISPVWKEAIIATGAELIVRKTMEERFKGMRVMVNEEGWYPATNFILPPVGSNCFGNQGYKTIAYEIYDDMGKELPDYILIPVSKGDLLWGVYEGFRELLEDGMINAIPKLVAVEPLERIQKVLEGSSLSGPFSGDFSLTESIGGSNMTYQAVLAVRESGGFSLAVSKDKIISSVYEAGSFGLYLETSSATIFSALHLAMELGKIERKATVMCIATSSGFKNDPLLFHI